MVNLIPRLLRVIIPLCGFFCVISCTKQDGPVQADTVEKLLSMPISSWLSDSNIKN